MQLILNSENLSLSPKDKMSLEQDSLNNKPITNGDIIEVEEDNKKINSNGTVEKMDIVNEVNDIANAQINGEETIPGDMLVVKGTDSMEISIKDSAFAPVKLNNCGQNVVFDAKSDEKLIVSENAENLATQYITSKHEVEKCQLMEVDKETSCDHDKQLQDPNLITKDNQENDVTDSINAMVQKIVQNFEEDTSTDDLMELNIECDNIHASKDTIETKEETVSSFNAATINIVAPLTEVGVRSNKLEEVPHVTEGKIGENFESPLAEFEALTTNVNKPEQVSVTVRENMVSLPDKVNIQLTEANEPEKQPLVPIDKLGLDEVKNQLSEVNEPEKVQSVPVDTRKNIAPMDEFGIQLTEATASEIAPTVSKISEYVESPLEETIQFTKSNCEVPTVAIGEINKCLTASLTEVKIQLTETTKTEQVPTVNVNEIKERFATQPTEPAIQLMEVTKTEQEATVNVSEIGEHFAARPTELLIQSTEVTETKQEPTVNVSEISEHFAAQPTELVIQSMEVTETKQEPTVNVSETSEHFAAQSTELVIKSMEVTETKQEPTVNDSKISEKFVARPTELVIQSTEVTETEQESTVIISEISENVAARPTEVEVQSTEVTITDQVPLDTVGKISKNLLVPSAEADILLTKEAASEQVSHDSAENDINQKTNDTIMKSSEDAMMCVKTKEEAQSKCHTEAVDINSILKSDTVDSGIKTVENIMHCGFTPDITQINNVDIDSVLKSDIIDSRMKTVENCDLTLDITQSNNVNKVTDTEASVPVDLNKKRDSCESQDTEIDSDITKAGEPSDSEKPNDIITVSSSESIKVSGISQTNGFDKQNSMSNAVAVINDDIVDLDEITESTKTDSKPQKTPENVSQIGDKTATLKIKLSNTLNILSDDEEEPPKKKATQKSTLDTTDDKHCINLDDDDDIMLIDEETTPTKDNKSIETSHTKVVKKMESETKPKDDNVKSDIATEKEACLEIPAINSIKTGPQSDVKIEESPSMPSDSDTKTDPSENQEKPQPLIPKDFFKSYRRNLSDMTRDDLEEFCILKIVESIIDRSNLNEIRAKIKTMAQNIDEYKKKAMMLTKQNRDLQVVLKSVQEEQKKMTDQPIAPLKITRSVGMQVLMTDRTRKRQAPIVNPQQQNNTATVNTTVNATVNSRTTRNTTQNRIPKAAIPQSIPVPRLVPAVVHNAVKSPAQNSVKPAPAQKVPEKRTHSRMQAQSQAQSPSSSQSVTVDLTDDEPPSKVATKSSPVPPVRLVNAQNLMAPRQQFTQPTNSPRKVYIPISGTGNQGVRSPGIMLKTVPPQGARPKGPGQALVRLPQQTLPMRRVTGRHPAPLPDNMKQYQPPNWKALPPAPDLKLSKVENGIVISWKIDGYQEDSYEEIASYQLYAYQETSAPPNTSLWKKIGDVKALPLPMACTLTQFMAGHKYYFAVRAVDIRSRLGPFSLPGSILLLNKM